MNNSFGCTWQLLTGICTDSDLIFEKNHTKVNNWLIDHVNNQCPCYNVSINEIFIADGDSFILGKENRVIIQTTGLKMNIQKYFRCVLTLLNGSIITTVGTINNNRLICDPFQVRTFNREIAIINRSLLDFL
jgi:hypothetical protein